MLVIYLAQGWSRGERRGKGEGRGDVIKISTEKCWICNWFTLRQKCSNEGKE